MQAAEIGGCVGESADRVTPEVPPQYVIPDLRCRVSALCHT